MSSSTFTRYQCDWCRAEVEIAHTGGTNGITGFAERPREWGHAQIEDEPLDLCAHCIEALRALAVSRGGAGAMHAVASEYASG